MKSQTRITRGLAKADLYSRGKAHILFQSMFLGLDEVSRFHKGANPIRVVIYDRVPDLERKSKLAVRKRFITGECKKRKYQIERYFSEIHAGWWEEAFKPRMSLHKAIDRARESGAVLVVLSPDIITDMIREGVDVDIRDMPERQKKACRLRHKDMLLLRKILGNVPVASVLPPDTLYRKIRSFVKKLERTGKGKSVKDLLQEWCSEQQKMVSQTAESDEFFLSGLPTVDKLVSNGKGWPTKSFVELCGNQSGKTTLCLTLCQHACQQGKSVVYLDARDGVGDLQIHGFGLSEYNGQSFHLHKASAIREIEGIIDEAIQSDSIAYIVLDDVSPLITEEMLEDPIRDYDKKKNARVFYGFFERAKIKLQNSPCQAVFLVLNYLGEWKNDFGESRFGASRGLSMKDYFDIRLQLHKEWVQYKKTEIWSGLKYVPCMSGLLMEVHKSPYSSFGLMGELQLSPNRAIIAPCKKITICEK